MVNSPLLLVPKGKKLFFVSGILLLILVSGVLVFQSKRSPKNYPVPTSYEDCIKNSRSGFNQVTCSIAYGEGEPEAKECLTLGGCNPGANDGLPGCRINFLNPKLKFPSTYDQCLQLQPGRGFDMSISVNEVKKLCAFYLGSACFHGKNSVDRLIDSCPADFTNKTEYGIATCAKEFSLDN